MKKGELVNNGKRKMGKYIKRKMEDKQEPLCSYLQKQLKKKNLKMVDVRVGGIAI